jgi:ornithine decarboxylase
MHCLRPAAVTAATDAFVAAFPGDVLYAVKCNPEPVILRAVRAGGVTHFDCASIGEVRLVRQMFADATIHFMHPVKARGAIGEAWERHDVRDFGWIRRTNWRRSARRRRRPALSANWV